LNIFFFLEAFIYKRNKLLLLITGFVILTTYSTTGLAILLFQVIIYVMRESKNNRMLIPVLISFCIPIYIILSMNVEEKLIGEKENSFNKRRLDFTQPLFIAYKYTLTGVGLDVVQFQKLRTGFYPSSESSHSSSNDVETTDRGCSNSITFLFATTGFPTALLLLYMFFKQQLITQRKGIFTFIIFISVLSEPILLRPFFFIFIVSGFIHTFNRITSHKQQIV